MSLVSHLFHSFHLSHLMLIKCVQVSSNVDCFYSVGRNGSGKSNFFYGKLSYNDALLSVF